MNIVGQKRGFNRSRATVAAWIVILLLGLLAGATIVRAQPVSGNVIYVADSYYPFCEVGSIVRDPRCHPEN